MQQRQLAIQFRYFVKIESSLAVVKQPRFVWRIRTNGATAIRADVAGAIQP
jgi:hypothetical protein